MYVLFRVIQKEFLQIRRDRRMIPMILVGPLIQLIAFGYAANTDVVDIPTVLVDQDRTQASRELVDRFVGSGYFDVVGAEDTVQGVEKWLVGGDALVALVIGEGYGDALASGETAHIQLIADGSDSNSAVVGTGYAARIVTQKGSEALQEALARRTPLAAVKGAALLVPSSPSVRLPPAGRIELIPRIWYNPDLKSRWFYVPAVLAMVLMLTTMILSSMGVVREKEIGTMEQLIVTPIKAWQLIVGKLLPFAIIGLVILHLVTALAVWHFGVPFRGSLILLVLLTALFLTNTLGLGLLMSTLVRTQQQAMMGSVFALMIPMIYLSGLIFPIENMPTAIQYVTYAIPLRYYAVIIRGIFLKGAGIAVLWPQAVAMALMGIGFLALASVRFRKRLD
ncbi:MAG: ABC transporter permease [Acidobacteriota bacterium]